jgi:methyl-accepting chemotaxis protein
MIILIITNLISLSVLGFLNYRESYQLLDNKLKLTSNQTLKEINGSIDNYLAGLESQIYTFSKLEILPRLMDKKQNAVTTTNIYFDLLNNYLKSIKEANDTILNVYFAENTKVMYVEPYADLTGYDPTATEWYQGAERNPDGVYWMDPYTDTATKKTTTTISKAVISNGKFIGVVGIDLDLEQLSSSLSNINVGEQGYIFVTDKKGITIAHPDTTTIGLDTVTTTDLWDRIKNIETGFSDYSYKNVTKFATYTTNQKTRWKIVASLDTSELTDDTNKLLIGTSIVLFMTLLVIAILSYFISKLLIKNIYILQAEMKKASNGDLTAHAVINSKDELQTLGDNFNSMVDGIRELISQVKESSTTVSDTSYSILKMSSETNNAINEIATTIGEVATGTNDQAKDIELNSVNINDLAQKLGYITISTNEMDQLSNATKILSQNGLTQIKTLVDKAEANTNISSKVNEIVLEVNNSSKEINSITDTINQIAEQTNLLALNAAIEAARAGEAGRGFSVVAEEIRKLAEQSSKATSDIASLINGMNTRTEEAVKAMDESKNVVEDQANSVNETKTIFQNILMSIEELSKKVNIINTSIIEIDAKKSQIVESTANLSAISEEISASTQEVSASTEEVSATTEVFASYSSELSNIADKLIEQINQFKI